MLKPNDLPLICLPTELSGEAAAHLVEFLYQLTEAIERHYFAQIHNHYHPENYQPDLDLQAPPDDPPF